MFTSQSLTRPGALSMNTGCQESVCVCVHRGRGVQGWMVSVIVSEREHTWDAVSSGPKSLRFFRAPLSGSSPAVATADTFIMCFCIIHDRKLDGAARWPRLRPPLHHHQSAAP